MLAEVKKEIELEIAHVLFLDIVGYSKLSVNEQHGRVDELNGIVRLSEQFQKAEAANRILKIPTGDGMALVFYKSPELSRVIQYFAITAAWAGEKELALQQLETGLPAPAASFALNYGALKLLPFWDPLRGDPRFEKIVASLAPKQ